MVKDEHPKPDLGDISPQPAPTTSDSEGVSADNYQPAGSPDTGEIDKNITIAQAQQNAHGQGEPGTKEPAKYSSDAAQTDSIYSAKVQKAVDDIEASEARADDEPYDQPKVAINQPKNKHFWKFKKVIYLAVTVIFIVAAIGVAVPTLRYKALNAVGVRSSLSLSVIDEKSQLPLKNVDVAVGAVSAKTDDQGKATLTGLKQGPAVLKLFKRSFGVVEEKMIIGWGSNPIGTAYHMNQAGETYKFVVSDFLSGNKIAGAKVTDGDSTAVSNKDGQLEIKIEPTDKEIKFTVTADGYRTDKLATGSGNKNEQQLKLVPAQPVVYISNRNSKLDLYKKDIDGNNEAILLPGTGLESTAGISLLQKPKTSQVAFVSNRDGQKNAAGFLLSYLYMVDSKTKQVSRVDGSEADSIQLIEWQGDRLIFAKITTSPNEYNHARQKIAVYDTFQDKVLELSSANNFNYILASQEAVYYATPDDGQPGTIPKLYKINNDGSSKKIVLDKEVLAIKRVSQGSIIVNTSDNNWQTVDLATDKISELQNFPKSQTDNHYLFSPSAKQATWYEKKDGKGTAMVADTTAENTPRALVSQGGLAEPISWLNDLYIVYRVATNDETADYATSITGGKPVKVTDVTPIAKTGSWYYFSN